MPTNGLLASWIECLLDHQRPNGETNATFEEVARHASIQGFVNTAALGEIYRCTHLLGWINPPLLVVTAQRSFVPQRLDRIDLDRPPRRDRRAQRAGQNQHHADRDQGQRIPGFHSH